MATTQELSSASSTAISCAWRTMLTRISMAPVAAGLGAVVVAVVGRRERGPVLVQWTMRCVGALSAALLLVACTRLAIPRLPQPRQRHLLPRHSTCHLAAPPSTCACQRQRPCQRAPAAASWSRMAGLAAYCTRIAAASLSPLSSLRLADSCRKTSALGGAAAWGEAGEAAPPAGGAGGGGAGVGGPRGSGTPLARCSWRSGR
jgi:hypothetical protein